MTAGMDSTPTPLIARPAVWIVTWALAFIAARLLLDGTGIATWIRVAAALGPIPLAGAALITILRAARNLDELEKRIQLEALAVAFVLAVLLLMTLGLMELAVALNRDDWSYRHVWALLPTLYLLGLIAARRRYA